jgi:hypothetical protein
MTDTALPPGLVMWPAGEAKDNRLCVLISDIHCTDCTVGNQTAEETDWKMFFDQLRLACRHPVEKDVDAKVGDTLDELILILNGDIVDLIRSSKWAEAGVYPWNRDSSRFEEIVLAVMQDIVKLHSGPPVMMEGKPYSGFFHWMRDTVNWLRAQGMTVTVVPIVGNHDKELQVVPAARKMFYEQCLGMTAADISPSYRAWIAAQLGTSIDEAYPCLPVYLADRGLRLLATHGQWRDADNVRPTKTWKLADGWQPACWQQDQYKAFSEPCFGDTIASGMLSHFIWRTANKMPKDTPGAHHIASLLDEMDLFRPSVAAVVCLLRESRVITKTDARNKDLRDVILRCFHESLDAWLSHSATWKSAPSSMWLGLMALGWLRRLKWYWIDVLLMQLMAKAQEPESSIETETVLNLPAFQNGYRELGLRLHVEGHTHVALEADVRFGTPQERRNYAYVNLGAWRDAIIPKRNKGNRRRGIGRALYIYDLPKLLNAMPEDAYRFYAVDTTSWGDRRDRW